MLDEGISEHFQPGGDTELQYGKVNIAPLLWQDDFIHGSDGIKKAMKASCKVNTIIKESSLARQVRFSGRWSAIGPNGRKGP